jgi:pyruvate formate-lyase/glycerol dehydratase family glycyl radical enzyme
MNWKYWGEPFAKTYMRLEHKPQAYRIAEAIKSAVEAMPVYLNPEDRFAAKAFERAIVGYSYGSGVYVDDNLADSVLTQENNPELAAEITQILQYFKTENSSLKVRESMTEEENKCGHMKVFWAGVWGGHTLLDYDLLLRNGTLRLKQMIKEKMVFAENQEEMLFLEALIIICEALEAFAARYAEEAHRLLEVTIDPEKRVELATIEAICRKVPLYPAETWREALQCFWFAFVFDGIDSPGRFDQYMYPYYSSSISVGEIDKVQAQELLEKLWQLFEKVRAWNLCIGGQLPDGRDASNELSYLILDIAEKYQFQAPNLTMRCHSGTPETLMNKAIEVIKCGIGMPALYNDEVVIPTLLNYGISLEDARDYALNGCNQIDIQGKSHMGLEDGELNLLKCLELALNRGCCRITGVRLGPDTGSPLKFTSFDQVLEAYKTQVAYFTEMLVRVSNKSQEIYARHAPNPYRSLFVSDCIENVRDFRSGGPRYNHGQVLAEGIANTADSLYSIKKLVYEKGLFTMEYLLKALDANFKGFEKVKNILVSKTEHYGNDSETVDSIATEIVTHFFSELAKYKTFRGGIYGGGCSPFTRAPEFGKMVGATPDGRAALSPVADSAGSVQGMDRKGPTALLNSAAKIDHNWTLSGYVVNLKFDKTLMSQDGTSNKIDALIKTFFKNGGQQLQVNVLNPRDLLEARKNPEKYKNLVVRVGGFSSYFVDLSPELQEDVITRTCHII